jgi:hypothetical protein
MDSLKKFSYYFFDMDEDGAPELCINLGIRGHLIYKYLPDTDRLVRWYEMDTTFLDLIGSGKISWSKTGDDIYGDRYSFLKLGKDGGTEEDVVFFRYYADKEICMAAFPWYADKDKAIELTDEIKSQDHPDETGNWYYFRTTGEQFAELTKDYFEAREQAVENLKEVTFSFDELFGEFMGE